MLKSRQFRLAALAMVLFSMTSVLQSCKDDDVPDPVNDEETITDVTLIFTNANDANDKVMATAVDPDGDGAQELQVQDTILLDTGKTYNLTFEVLNKLEDPAGDIGEEIDEEGAEHQIFFGFTNDAFANPTGDGNIDNGADAVNYTDKDANDNPIGLETTWTTGSSAVSDGDFTVRLQHQPDVKSATTGANDGDTDFEITFKLEIK